MRDYFGLIGRERPYRLLWIGRTAAMLGSTTTLFALLLYLAQSGASPTEIGGVLVARALPQALGPLAGAVSDRVDARKVMVSCDVGQAACVGAIAVFMPPYPALVALVAVSSVFSAMFLPAGKGAIPKLVHRDDLTSANALMGASFNFAVAAGPALGSVLVATAGAGYAFALGAATFAFSAAAVSRLPSLSPEAKPESGFLPEVREGLSYLVAHRVARAVALGLFLSVAFAALDNVALVFMVTETFGAGEFAFGLSGTAYGAAMILAPLALARLPGFSDAPERLLFLGLFLTGAGLALGGLSPGTAVFVILYFIAGAGNGLENVACDTLIGKTVAESKLGRVFGAVYGPIFLADALAAAVGCFLLAATSPRVVFIIAGCGVLAVLVLVRAMMPRSPADSH